MSESITYRVTLTKQRVEMRVCYPDAIVAQGSRDLVMAACLLNAVRTVWA